MRSQENERMNTQLLAVRANPSNPDHHLWNNNGTWWCHFTVHSPDYTKERVRLSLKTRDRLQARKIRDSLLARYENQPPQAEELEDDYAASLNLLL